MRLSLITAFWVSSLFCCCFCGWETPIEVYSDGKNVFEYIDSFMDSTATTHIIIATRINNYRRYAYIKIDSNNKVSNLTWFYSKQAIPGRLIPFSITGDKTGEHLYVALVLGILAPDIYFAESSDKGQTWTEPVRTRSNIDPNDLSHRTSPKIVYLENVGISILYFKREDVRQLMITSRTLTNSSWGEEIYIELPNCKNIDDTFNLAATSLKQKDGTHSILFTTACYSPDKQLIMGESDNKGGNWNIIHTDILSECNYQNLFVSTTEDESSVYICFQEYCMNTDYARKYWIYEYLPRKGLEEIYLDIIHSAHFHTLGIVKRGNKHEMFAFAADANYTNETNARMYNIPIDEPWKHKVLPLPKLGEVTDHAKVYAKGGKVVVVGSSSDKIVLVQRYNFE